MKQLYKQVYFTDHPAPSSQQRHLTIAFGQRDSAIFDTIKPLTSYEVRELIGHHTFASLQEAANREGLAVNTYCLRSLRLSHRTLREKRPFEYGQSALQWPDEPLVDPLQTTFRGGGAEPLHAWYPYLEGYSPGFVRRLMEEFAPDASSVIDPFSGTGTTPLTVALAGKQAAYCEVNPLLQFLTDVKISALTMGRKQRADIAGSLMRISEQLAALVGAAAPDNKLSRTYAKVFGESVFFEEAVYDSILRMRTMIDKLACTEPESAKYVTVAVLAQLIPASRLIRRGDVRFKTAAEMQRMHVDFVDAVRKSLIAMSSDIERLDSISTRPFLMCEDARHLGRLPSLHIDAVITSPPYLNGTNYFRNTKVELWFLRCLQTNQELAGYRYKAVTAGINDVTVNKPLTCTARPLASLVQTLMKDAYDARIPRMVASYFSDMKVIFEGLRHHLNDGAAVLIDIGDSRYGNIHVPTDRLLESILLESGFTLEREAVLRTRSSRNGTPLRQVLLALRFNAGSTAKYVVPTYELQNEQQGGWQASWEDFKAKLPHQHGQFARRNWGHQMHSLCSYQGKMKPGLAFHLVKTFVPDGGTVLDPFGGVGTISFEASLQGKRSWAFEIGPAPLHIAAAKVGQPVLDHCEQVLNLLEAFIQDHAITDDELASADSINFNGRIPDYFHPETLREILLARRYFREFPAQSPSESLVLASLLHLLHGNRPYALSRRSHPITPFAPTGPTEYRALMPRLRTKVARSLAQPLSPHFVPGRVLFQDATTWWPQDVDQLDAVITSPPFFDGTRFYLANWMRLWFCGWEAADFNTQPKAFVDERQKAGFQVYEPIFRQARERLKPGGVMVLHLGKSKKCDMAEALSAVAKRWFRVADIFAESVEHCETHGISDKGTVKEHTYLVLS